MTLKAALRRWNSQAEKRSIGLNPSFLRAFVAPLLFPLAGFVLLWGVMKSIAWVATGFIASKGI